MGVRRSFHPLYYQIEQEILREIQDHQMQPGDRLPSEAEIAQRFHVSRITSRRVLADLVTKGVAYSQQGRGTFVALPRIQTMSGFLSFSDDMANRGLVPSSLVVQFEKISPNQTVHSRLQLQGEEHVFCLKRVRLANGSPVALETAYLPAQVCPGLDGEDLAYQSLFKILREKYGVIPTWSEAEIEATSASPEEADFLNCQPGAPLLCANRLTYSQTYAVIEAVRSVYSGDRFTFFTGRQFIG
jgi:GntR family transcriptional regulator